MDTKEKDFINSFVKDTIKQQIQRQTTSMARTFLVLIEDLIKEGYVIPQDKYDQIRKKVLDSNGYAFRELWSLVDKVEINVKIPYNDIK